MCKKSLKKIPGQKAIQSVKMQACKKSKWVREVTEHLCSAFTRTYLYNKPQNEKNQIKQPKLMRGKQMFSDEFDEFRIFEENMNRMFEKIWGIPVNRSLLLPGERTTTGAIEKYRKPFIDLVETDKEVIATVEMPGLDK